MSPKGPEAEFGTIVHRAITAARQGEQHPGRWFLQALEERRAELATDSATERYADLASCVQPGKVSEAIALITSNFRPRRTSAISNGGGVPRGKRRGPDVPLASSSLRLRGSADFISDVDGGVEIIDFKSGSVTDRDGEIRRSYRLQLLAYALMLREREPTAHIFLALDNGSRTPVMCDEHAMQEALEEIDRVVSALPVGDDVSSKNLADPGPDCAVCSLRPSCSEYQMAAPEWWRDVPTEIPFAPSDSWGEVKSIDVSSDRVTLIDAAGRGVRIDRLSPSHGLGDVPQGQQLWFFGLVPDSIKRGFGGERPHPRLFHDLPADGTGKVAWALQVLL